MNNKSESIYRRYYKMPSWKDWVMGPRGLLKEGGRVQALKVKPD